MATKKAATSTKKKPAKKNILKEIDYKPIILNPIIVFVYAALGFLLLNQTELNKVDVWVKAGFAGLIALLSFIRNSIKETRNAIKG